MKIKNIVYLIIGLFLIGGWFYWTQIRVKNIKIFCYESTKLPRENERNLEWSSGKEWGLGEIGNSPRKPEYTMAQKYDWGWVYRDRNWGSTELTHLNDLDRQNYLYNSCLKENGLY